MFLFKVKYNFRCLSVRIFGIFPISTGASHLAFPIQTDIKTIANRICNFVRLQLQNRVSDFSLYSTSGASLLYVIALQILFGEVHTSLRLSVASCPVRFFKKKLFKKPYFQVTINIFFFIVSILKMWNCILVIVYVFHWKHRNMILRTQIYQIL